ncbi:MAG: ABC transporter ATP-binding protein [Alphaproteobacteria bacterium]|nr:ABC transporter ATP-binding protein [Alphaproteobacteria bacterium]
MTALLEIRGVTVRFGGVTAIDNVSFQLEQGELLGLIGPNGAGKTTMLRSITGVVRPQNGEVCLNGVDISRLPIHVRVRRGLGLSQQIVRPFRQMTVLDNVALTAGHMKTADPLRALLFTDRSSQRARARELLDLVGIGDTAQAMPSSLPLGYLKRLEVARALALEPTVLLLDEPLAGLNSIEAARLADTIVKLNGGGLSVVLIEHNLGEVLRICSRLVVLDNGRKIGDGRPEAVMADGHVRAAYLGVEASDAAA